ncbi:hypothetical protein [Lysobacter fragariae]
MKNAALLVLASTLAFAGCSQEAPAPQATPQQEATQAAPAPAPVPEPAAPAAPQPPKPTTPERMAEIEAMGQTGIWATMTEVCKKEVKQGLRTTLMWNVKATGAERVILYVVDPNGSERNFARGQSVGERETGPWLRPGLTFRIRNYDTKADLGTLVIGEKSC